MTEAEELLKVPESVVKSITDFTVDPQPMYVHREKVARMIEKLNRE